MYVHTGTVRYAEKSKIGIFTCPLDITQTETKGTVLIHSAKEMLTFTKGEEKYIENVGLRHLVSSRVDLSYPDYISLTSLHSMAMFFSIS